jgi:hypothetical protein
MRNALILFVLLPICGLVSSARADVASDAAHLSVYATPIAGHDSSAAGLNAEDTSLIPVRYPGVAQTSLADQTPVSVALPQSSTVEAIPTPTAFHAGGLLLVLIFVTRCVRKLRWA